ncbi:MAG: LPS export ABC transporter permease LptG [Burkholderiales bacterium]|jgi:lipopolysaccharide export system permease protein|nr:LPS export ABC transporter permease LptG [Burkholderiales bacterium]
MKTLNHYLQREMLLMTALLFVGIVLFFAFFDLINELGDLGRGKNLSSMFLSVALKLPSRCYELAPVSALLGTMYVLSQMVANSEFTVMRVSGVSLWQIGRAIIMVGVPIALLTFLAGEFVAPPAERLAANVKSAERSGDLIAQQFSSGFWFKENEVFANIRAATSSHILMDVRLYTFDKHRKLVSIKSAKRGVFSIENNTWQLEDVKVTQFDGSETRLTEEPVYEWHTVLRPSILTVYQTPPEQLEIKTLFDNIDILSRSAQDTSRFRIALWSKIVYPLNIFVMMLLALPFSQFQRRQSGVGFRIFAGALIGLTFFLIGRLFSYIGTLNHWYPLFAAFTPTVLFLVLLILMLRRQERR